MNNQSKAVSAANALRRKDLTGKVFYELTVTGYNSQSKKWMCSCSCGNTSEVKTAALNNGNTKSCGCFHKRQASASATNRHRTKRVERGLSPDTHISTKSVIQRQEFKEMSSEIKIRDSFTCAWCSVVGGKLAVHHIKPWASHPELRFDRFNVVTLCTKCHVKVHNGKYHNDPDPIMSILLEGYAKEIEVICMRVELT